MNRRHPISTGSGETDSLRWIIISALCALVVVALLGMLVALAWISAVAGDAWGVGTYGSIAILVIVMTLRNL